MLIDDRRVAGSNWQLDTEFLSYLVDNSTRHQIPINEVRYIDFPLSGGEAALLGSWRGALIGAPIGALVGLLIWKGGSSCSPEPCTPRDVGGAENILIGALGFGGLGAVLAGGIGLANGGRLRFRFNP